MKTAAVGQALRLAAPEKSGAGCYFDYLRAQGAGRPSSQAIKPASFVGLVRHR
jgi:hypothetical protein